MTHVYNKNKVSEKFMTQRQKKYSKTTLQKVLNAGNMTDPYDAEYWSQGSFL